MATEYDVLRSLLSRSERHNRQPGRRFDKHISIRKLLSLLRIPLRGMRHRLPNDQRSDTRSTHMS
jgi:hypothetical protein